ncbi:T9SS type A sorting domain-containing protein [Lacinutrix himadriensis]|uniref:T9SS type A sorting domain-containing protein n=1 Tax=Lacinutrix himadriensis TaxID=641549 RepID=UPI0006E1C28A|nr:T9SS type A sorting domain-containing protein [Lacinutrix himadriensis]
MLGTSAGANQTTGLENVFIGRYAGFSNINGTDNTFIGTEAGRLNTATDNTFIGTEVGENNTTGYDNTFIGEESGTSNTIGRDNVFIGEDAGFSNTEGDDNTFVGSTAGRTNTTGEGNTFVGGESNSGIGIAIDESLGGNGAYELTSLYGGVGYDNTTGHGNSFFGSGAGADNGVGIANTFLGYGAGASTEYADLNTFVGYGAGYDNNRTNSTSNANRNTYLGAVAGGVNREGSDNVGIGHDANFSANTGGERNVFIGGGSRVRGTDNIVIGYNASTRTNDNRNNQIVIGANSSTTENNAIVIGNNVTSTTANTLTLGGDTVTNRYSVGIGTLAANPNASLELADTDKGLLINRLTTAERVALETAAADGNPIDATHQGLMVYDTDLDALVTWDGTLWNVTEANTDSQAISVTSDVLSITGDAGTVDLSGYLDNTDAQGLTLSGTTLGITGNATTIDLSTLQDGAGTDEQAISLATNTLSISGNASTVDLSGYLDNTDAQNLTSATLSGNTLTVAIEGGNSVMVDLSPILSDLTTRMETLEACACQTLSAETPGLDDHTSKSVGPILYQNIPNPFNGTTSIKYYVPTSNKSAAIVFSNTSGQIIDNVSLTKLGDHELFFNSDSLASGMYYYTLYVNGRKIDTKKMVID